MGKAEGERADQHGQCRGLDDGEAGPQDDENAGDAEDHRGEACRGQAFAQKNRCEYRRPQRGGELDGKHGGQWNQPDRIKPAELAAEVNQVARCVQF